MYNYLEFEKPIAELESKLNDLKKAEPDNTKDIARLQRQVTKRIETVYKVLTPWQKTQIARHQNRPRFLSFASRLFTDITTLAGDRHFGNDEAIQAGLARFNGRPIAFLGQERGTDTKTRIKYNFGSPLPEGYRKAQRIMELANRFSLPVISLVDTSGAYPGVSAEERGQAEAIASSIYKTLEISVPIIAVIIGEGGSGGALAIAAANKVYMLEHAVYSVISPEGAASILWRDSSRALEAATNMKITAQDLYELKIIDGIIPEPLGGAHRDHNAAIDATSQMIEIGLKSFKGKSPETIKQERYEKYLAIGRHLT